jgi:hypothetical protein
MGTCCDKKAADDSENEVKLSYSKLKTSDLSLCS